MAFLSSYELLFVAVGGYLVYCLVVYPFFLCPTRHLPGTYISKVTSLWESHLQFRLKDLRQNKRLHEKYGPIVRLAPHLVSCSSTEALTALYGARSNIGKPQNAVQFENFGKPNAFSTVGRQDHKRRRARYATFYSKSNMSQGEAYQSILKRTVEIVKKFQSAADSRKPINIFMTFHHYALDNVSALAYGNALGMMHGNNPAFSDGLRSLISGLTSTFAFPWMPFFWSLPGLQLLAPSWAIECLQAIEILPTTTLSQFREVQDESSLEIENTALKKLKSHKGYLSPDLTELHVASELHDHVFAGGDTTSSALMWLFYELSRPEHTEHVERLVLEIQKLRETSSSFPETFSEIDECSWLDCCVKESMRLHAPTGTHLMREVREEEIIISGFQVPPKTQVGLAPYSLQRNENIFRESHLFKPEWWLSSDKDLLQEMKLAWIPFGHGTRVCVGQHLAMVEIKLMTVLVFSQLKLQIDESRDPRDMDAMQAAVEIPRGGVCFLKCFNRQAGSIELKGSE